MQSRSTASRGLQPQFLAPCAGAVARVHSPWTLGVEWACCCWRCSLVTLPAVLSNWLGCCHNVTHPCQRCECAGGHSSLVQIETQKLRGVLLCCCLQEALSTWLCAEQGVIRPGQQRACFSSARCASPATSWCWCCAVLCWTQEHSTVGLAHDLASSVHTGA